MRVRSKRRFCSFLTFLFLLLGLGIFLLFNKLSKDEKPQEKVIEVIEIELFPKEIEKKTEKSIEKSIVNNEVTEEVKVLESQSSVKYINTNNQKVTDSLESDKKIDFLRKGTKINILETKVKKDKEMNENWVKISYKKDLKERTGWVPEKSLVSSLLQTLPKDWANLDFSYDKPMADYPNNRKVVVKGVYINIHTMASEKKLERLIALTKKTEINAFVIDVKDDNGVLLFKMDAADKYNPLANKYIPIKNIDQIMKKLKENNIYTIARIVSFKDPLYAKANPDKAITNRQTNEPFTNSDGIIWVSPHDRNLWAYNISVAEEAAKIGFNEIQFDYVRFPASNGGKLDKVLDYKNTKKESKPETIQQYLKYARNRLSPLQVYTSADIYGQIGTFPDDMALGQYWEAIAGVVDYVSPMKYPSHYGNGAYGIPVPDAQPYKTIYASTRDSVNRNENIENPAIIRPWIQAFTAKWVKGNIPYREKEIKEQIRAMKDLGVNEYLLWSPSNNYDIGA